MLADEELYVPAAAVPCAALDAPFPLSCSVLVSLIDITHHVKRQLPMVNTALVNIRHA